jgi:signal transduction histidine kinase
MVKVRIGTKLLITYFVLLVITFSVTALSYDFLSRRYLINETRKQLKTEGRLIADTLKNAPLSDADIREKLLQRRDLNIAGRFIDARVIVLNRDRKLIYTNLEAADRGVILKLSELQDKAAEGYVTERLPIISPKGELKGHVFLLTRIKDINSLNLLMRRTQILSFLIAGLVALSIALFFERSLTGPIQKLMARMVNFSLKDYKGEPDIKTGDEIEELASCFNKMAEKLKRYDEQQKRFLQNTSHELKTPLMSIQGYAEAIKDGVVEGREMEESLDIIIAQSQRLKKIVEELIYLTKLENVEETFNLQRNNIGKIIEKAVKSIRPLTDEKGIEVSILGEFDYDGMYDWEKLERAFINLLGNAVRYAENRITVKADTTGSKIQIEVIDDGPGFTDGEEHRVFDRFYKGHKGGTGLGLAITKAIIEGHRGEISAFNNKPAGAVFRVILPIIQAL